MDEIELLRSSVSALLTQLSFLTYLGVHMGTCVVLLSSNGTIDGANAHCCFV